MSFEQLFASSVLNVVVPDTSVEYPPEGPADEWLKRLAASSVERKQAFFGAPALLDPTTLTSLIFQMNSYNHY